MGATQATAHRHEAGQRGTEEHTRAATTPRMGVVGTHHPRCILEMRLVVGVVCRLSLVQVLAYITTTTRVLAVNTKEKSSEDTRLI